jgi:hypothetical protein
MGEDDEYEGVAKTGFEGGQAIGAAAGGDWEAAGDHSAGMAWEALDTATGGLLDTAFGESGKEAFQQGLHDTGTRLGGSVYDLIHPDTLEAVRDKYRQQMPDIDSVTVPGSEVGLPDVDQVTIPLH